MENSEATIKVGDLKTLRINPDRTGFYAVNNRQLADVVWRSGSSAYDRWGIIFDAFQFLLSGMMKFSEYKSVLDRFEHEDEYLPAQEVSNQLGVLYVLSPSRITPISRRFHRVLLDRFTQKSGEKSSILCGTLASRLAQIDPEYARNLASRFNDYENISPDMRAAVAIAYAKTTNDLDKLISAYRRSGSDEDKNTLLGAMTVFDQEELVKKALDFAFSGEVKRQDMIFAVAGAVANPAVRNMVWDWMKRNLGRLQELYQGTGLLSKLSSLIPILCVGRVEEAERYFATHMIPGAETAIKLGLEKLHAYDRLAKEIANEISEV
jgi:aminopeptidase N